MEKIVLSETEIQSIVTRLGQEISRDYQHEELPPIILCVMKGAMVFCADLIRHIDIDGLYPSQVLVRHQIHRRHPYAKRRHRGFDGT